MDTEENHVLMITNEGGEHRVTILKTSPRYKYATKTGLSFKTMRPAGGSKEGIAGTQPRQIYAD